MKRRSFRRRKARVKVSRRVRQRRGINFELERSIAKEIWAVLYMALAALIYYSFDGKLAEVGEMMKAFLGPIFGYGVYFLPFLFLGIALTLFFLKGVQFGLSRILGIFLLIVSSLTVVHLSLQLDDYYNEALKGNFGGLIGFVGAFILVQFLGQQGSYIVGLAVFLIALLLTFQISLISLLSVFFRAASSSARPISGRKELPKISEELKKELDIVKPISLNDRTENFTHGLKEKSPLQKEVEFELDKSVNLAEEKTDEAKKEFEKLVELAYEFPPLDLLSDVSSHGITDDQVLKKNAKLISDKLAQFGIQVVMHSVNVGPTVIQYTLKPHAGVKLSKITNLKNDLALALAARAIRIEAPIPGKSMVGIEIPNDSRSTVRLREILESKEFRSSNEPLKLPIGRDVSGLPIIDSLSKMPHLLIAGATGSGKSVGVNSFLISLLYQYSPKDLKLILIDPKRVELNNYNAIPHLLCPVITEPAKANIALRWTVKEMNDRYRLCAESGHRNIHDYNSDLSVQRKIPYIVVMIDELADLMMTLGKEVEASICRIAQMARAVGIHLIVATQRPSVDVITGLIKANIPARIAFTVVSQVDSRTIIDSIGAEDLLGYGDMLFLPGNTGRPFRVQGTFVSSKEIERVANRIKLHLSPEYIEEITSEDLASESVQGIPDSHLGLQTSSDDDNLYEDAVNLVLETKKASASFLQRRLSIGYARAARLLDLMEQNGVVGPTRGAKARDVYQRS